MEKIYANSEEKYLKAVVLYGLPATGGDYFSLFYDAEGTQQAHNSDYDWKDLFMKGLIRVVLFLNNVYTTFSPMQINDPTQLVTTISFGFGDFSALFFADDENQSSGGLLPGDGGKFERT